jgi:drug/metabolite transporter (DMT)-like permease
MVGLGCLFSNEANLNPKEGVESSTKGSEFYNEKMAFAYSLISSILYAIT